MLVSETTNRFLTDKFFISLFSQTWPWIGRLQIKEHEARTRSYTHWKASPAIWSAVKRSIRNKIFQLAPVSAQSSSWALSYKPRLMCKPRRSLDRRRFKVQHFRPKYLQTRSTVVMSQPFGILLLNSYTLVLSSFKYPVPCLWSSVSVHGDPISASFGSTKTDSPSQFCSNRSVTTA
jgi:hypothetical protein